DRARTVTRCVVYRENLDRPVLLRAKAFEDIGQPCGPIGCDEQNQNRGVVGELHEPREPTKRADTPANHTFSVSARAFNSGKMLRKRIRIRTEALPGGQGLRRTRAEVTSSSPGGACERASWQRSSSLSSAWPPSCASEQPSCALSSLRLPSSRSCAASEPCELSSSRRTCASSAHDAWPASSQPYVFSVA